jgi:NADH-quinone oxidoreductase subunit G
VGGPLHDGDPGVRLLEPKKDAELQYFKNVPKVSELGEGKMLAIPRYHIFGSDELSEKSPAIAELSPEAYIGISSEDAKRLGLNEEDFLQLEFAGSTHRHKAKIIEGLPAGLLALPHGINTFHDFSEPEVDNLKKNGQ